MRGGADGAVPSAQTTGNPEYMRLRWGDHCHNIKDEETCKKDKFCTYNYAREGSKCANNYGDLSKVDPPPGGLGHRAAMTEVFLAGVEKRKEEEKDAQKDEVDMAREAQEARSAADAAAGQESGAQSTEPEPETSIDDLMAQIQAGFAVMEKKNKKNTRTSGSNAPPSLRRDNMAREAAPEPAAAANEDGDVQEVLCYVRAVYDYASEKAGDLSFVVGDVIAVTEKKDDEWWYGYLDNDPRVEGEFPAKEYVEEIADPSEPESPRLPLSTDLGNSSADNMVRKIATEPLDAPLKYGVQYQFKKLIAKAEGVDIGIIDRDMNDYDMKSYLIRMDEQGIRDTLLHEPDTTIRFLYLREQLRIRHCSRDGAVCGGRPFDHLGELYH